MVILKKHIPIAMAFIMGMLGIGLFFSPLNIAKQWTNDLSEWGQIIAAFAMIIGIYSLLNHHYHKIKRKVPGWAFSILVFIGMVAMVTAGMSYKMDTPEKEEFGTWSLTKQHRLLALSGAQFVSSVEERDKLNEEALGRGEAASAVLDTPEGYIDGLEIVRRVPIMWLYDFIFVPMNATMFSLLAFYIASAAYRAFRARTPEATVLLVTAILMMVGRVPIGEMIWSKFPDFTNWILNTPSMAVMRGIMIGVGLGIIATSLRIIFGIERTYMGGGGD